MSSCVISTSCEPHRGPCQQGGVARISVADFRLSLPNTMATGITSRGIEAGARRRPPTPSSAEIEKKGAELYISSSIVFSWHVPGLNLPLPWSKVYEKIHLDASSTSSLIRCSCSSSSTSLYTLCI